MEQGKHTQMVGARAARHRAVRRRARRVRGQRRAALDRGRSRPRPGGSGVAGQRVRAGLRRLPAARRADGRPARAPRVFMAGFVLFAVASFAGGLATSGGTLIAARALQGLGAAILSPAALSLVTTTFAEGAERNTALGVWGAVAAGGGAAGSLLGGVITQTLGLGVGAVDQHADRHRRRALAPAAAARVQDRHGRPLVRRARRADRDRRPGRARLRRHRRRPGRVRRARRRAAGRVRRSPRAARANPLVPLASSAPAA